MPSLAPLAENDRFAIWRIGRHPASDIVLDKETGRWAVGTAAATRLDSRGSGSDEERQEAIVDLARELGFEMTDGSSPLACEGPTLRM
jgi:hypothetical protein